MSMLSVFHPDILKFIDAKSGDTKKFTRSNFSVCMDSKFYETLAKTPDKIFKTKNVVDGAEHPLKDDAGVLYTYQMLWDKIINNAWKSAEPGIFNGDIAAERCTCKHITREVYSNPCSEYVHIPFTSCNLASLNLFKFVFPNGKFDWIEFGHAVEEATVYLNGVIDNNKYPVKRIEDETLAVRPIGLGFMGLGHLLYAMGIPYNSIEAYQLSADISRFMTLTSMRRSMELAKKNGKTYKYYNHDVFMDANKRFFVDGDDNEFMGINIGQLKADIKKYGVYNSCFTSIAPTGTISYIADTSGSGEPIFGLVFTRKIEKENKNYEEVFIVDPVFQQFVESKYPDKKKEIYDYVSKHQGSCQGCELLTEQERKVFVVAGDISADWHLKILSGIANNISLSVSKTINLPSNCTPKDIGDVYIKANKIGVIGVAVYRDGSREGILVHDSGKGDFVISKNNAPKRPKDVAAEMNFFTIGKHKYYTSVGFDKNGSPSEVFVGFNEGAGALENLSPSPIKGINRKLQRGDYVFLGDDKSKLCLTNGHSDDAADALTRMISSNLRHGADISFVVHQLEKTKGSMLSFSKVLARTLKRYVANGSSVHGEECPDCKSKLIRIEGCIKCSSPTCSWSKCG